MHKKIFICIAIFFFLFPMRAQAQLCETTISAIPSLTSLELSGSTLISNFATQEINFIETQYRHVGILEVTKRLGEFEKNIVAWFSKWWDSDEGLKQALEDISAQMALGELNNTLTKGKAADAQAMNETKMEQEAEKVKSRQRYKPSDLACQLDTAGPGQIKAYQFSNALNRGFAMDTRARRNNAKTEASAAGRAAEVKEMWDEYKEYFCNEAYGDQGCEPGASGGIKGKHKDISAYLWGAKQTIDMKDPDVMRAVKASLRYLIYPMPDDPIPGTALTSAEGRAALLDRRSHQARINTIYNVFGQMLAQRVGGSGVDTAGLRAESGAVDPSSDASYRELQEAMGRDRFYNTNYILEMVGNPEQVTREQLTTNAIRLQTMNDIYKRSEELLFMMAAEYASELDKQVPNSAVNAAPLN